jgi:glutamine amidotransferase-like uncharacterized protein
MRIALAAILCCTCSTPLLADPFILRCDSPKGALSFSVLIDPASHSVLNMGFATKVATDQFTETMIAASSKETEPSQILVIDRITGQFQLSWIAANPSDKGGSYQGTCAVARRLF